MIFKHFLTQANESNSFLVACEDTREAILIDVGSFERKIADFIEENSINLTTVFITHNHYDHTGGLSEAALRYDITIFAEFSQTGGCPAKRVMHGDTIKVGSLTGTVLATPGHTPDSLSLAFPGMVFTGDALFAGSVGGASSPSNAKKQIDAIRKHIFTLPPETELHTGHGPSSTVAIESKYNPFFCVAEHFKKRYAILA